MEKKGGHETEPGLPRSLCASGFRFGCSAHPVTLVVVRSPSTGPTVHGHRVRRHPGDGFGSSVLSIALIVVFGSLPVSSQEPCHISWLDLNFEESVPK